MIAQPSIPIIARVEVQQRFCSTCSSRIKEELKKLNEIKNIRLYPKDSIIIFNFSKANDLSKALNTLSEIGYNEVGTYTTNQGFNQALCNCYGLKSLVHRIMKESTLT